MTKEEIIRIEYEAIKKFANGDKQLAYQVVYKLSPLMRNYIEACEPRKVTCDELCDVINKASRILAETH